MGVCFTSLNNNTPLNHEERSSFMRSLFFRPKIFDALTRLCYSLYSILLALSKLDSQWLSVFQGFFFKLDRRRALHHMSFSLPLTKIIVRRLLLLARTASRLVMPLFRLFACLFWWMGDGGSFEGGKTDDNTFAWQRLLKCQADDCTRISSAFVSTVKAFK